MSDKPIFEIDRCVSGDMKGLTVSRATTAIEDIVASRFVVAPSVQPEVYVNSRLEDNPLEPAAPNAMRVSSNCGS